MSDLQAHASKPGEAPNTPSQEFAAYCEAECERRLNSGLEFNQEQFRKAMQLVMDKLERLEAGDSA